MVLSIFSKVYGNLTGYDLFVFGVICFMAGFFACAVALRLGREAAPLEDEDGDSYEDYKP
jgi:hypothetical protein